MLPAVPIRSLRRWLLALLFHSHQVSGREEAGESARAASVSRPETGSLVRRGRWRESRSGEQRAAQGSGKVCGRAVGVESVRGPDGDQPCEGIHVAGGDSEPGTGSLVAVARLVEGEQGVGIS